MATYRQRLVTEATLAIMDEMQCGLREAMEYGGHKSLATIARDPAVVAGVNYARSIFPKDSWASINTAGAAIPEDYRRAAMLTWNAMPGYTCLADAVAIIARL